MKDLGINGLTIEGYGCAGLTLREACVAFSELSKFAGGVPSTFMVAQCVLAMNSIYYFGSEE